MLVLGVDPGSRRCGYALVKRAGTGLLRVDSGVLVPGDLPVAERLAAILVGLSALLEGGGVGAVAVETAFCGRSPRSALALGQARGVALAAAARAGLPVFEYAPAEVKRAFTGHGRADKSQMLRTARALFGLEARLADEADALAIAVCHLSGGAARAGAWAAAAARAGKSGPRATLRANGALRPAIRRYAGVP